MCAHVKGWKAYFVIILQADIVRCAIDDAESCHIMGALPTGYGKSLPMLKTGLLMPPGKWTHKIYATYVYFFSIGSTVIVVSALTAIAQQLLSDCKGYGIEALSSNQASEVNGNIFQVLLDNGFQDLSRLQP